MILMVGYHLKKVVLIKKEEAFCKIFKKISRSTLVWEIKATRNKFLNVSACFTNLQMVFAKTLEWII